MPAGPKDITIAHDHGPKPYSTTPLHLHTAW
jgi:hypothetical protein